MSLFVEVPKEEIKVISALLKKQGLTYKEYVWGLHSYGKRTFYAELANESLDADDALKILFNEQIYITTMSMLPLIEGEHTHCDDWRTDESSWITNFTFVVSLLKGDAYPYLDQEGEGRNS